MNTRDTLKVNSLNHLEIGGCDTVELVKKFGTPLYCLDEAYVRNVCRVFSDTIKNEYGDGAVAYASKALSCVAIYKIVKEENICVDVVSGGEIYTALKAGFNPEKMFFHGNNKLISELEYAIGSGIGYIVVDSFDEIDLISEIAGKLNKTQKVLFRVNPGIEAHTHHSIQTATVDSKFGFSISNGDAVKALVKAINASNVNPVGFHCHIGSQIFDKNAFGLAVDKMTDFIKNVKNMHNFDTEILNMGGGYGIYYTEGDPHFTLDEYADYVKRLIVKLKECIKTKQIKKPALVIEPGRSIVGEAGITLYTVGAVKEIKDVRKYVAIDGGMGDNPRFALYQAKYEAVFANRVINDEKEIVTVAGKCCESGDMIAVDVNLPNAKRGDIVAVFSTGAYNYSMSSNYNRNPIPPMILVKDGKADYMVKPQTYDDIIRNDVVPNWIKG